MLIGVPKEIKSHEYRVGLLPGSVRELTRAGLDVIVETDAGAGIGYNNEAYLRAGASIEPSAETIFARADMIVKVKEPQAIEVLRLRPNQILFTYLHLAANKTLAEELAKSGAICVAYETVTDDEGRLPLLAPMSEIAGHMSVQVGARYLEKPEGGRGILLGGVPGTQPARVTILGGGVSGTNAARMAAGLEADVLVIDRSLSRLARLSEIFGSRIRTGYATTDAIEEAAIHSDLIIGAVLVPGAASPKLIGRSLLKRMRARSVVVDISIDQGGCFETSQPTTHEHPTYVEENIIHYCVANMPGGVARTSSFALNNATLPYVITLATKGWRGALSKDSNFRNGLNVCDGNITHQAVADELGMRHVAAETMVAA